MEKLFQNEILIKADKNSVQQFLLTAPNWLKWNWAIGKIEPVAKNTYAIHRDVDALNKDEIVEIKALNNKIVCKSTTGRLEYQLIFELAEQAGLTKITETLYPTNNLHLPLTLLAPIAKHAFNQNLQVLKDLLEVQVTKL
ncbi:hypothetical protein D1B17_03855 [Companilactobacillus zhachilii]|uniref:SRPBCC family protein n=1 Tax=Companilactobacillus zhachilii TaxID=2304606 RepID=A0A386PSW9_9LACO|nr:hypothetical protein [Companilactobacillus zhachilii]AYE37813.1 hypothetical protein D1B17_03855 [Companilactobacillus zhachilii]